ncbi:MAG TPA: VWA domain-containing protein [Granulicella sp.]
MRAWILAAGAFLCLPAWGQGTPGDAPTLTTTTRLVVVPALVRSQAGELIHTLQAEDFRLTDDGAPQTLSLEDAEGQPVSAVVLMQTGGAAAREFKAYSHLLTMLDYLMASSSRRVAMVSFDSQPEEQWDFTTHIEKLEDGFTNPTEGDGKAAIFDAVNYGIELLKKEPPNRRRVLILLSQTHDDGSKAHAEDVVRGLGENNVIIYSVAFSVEKNWLKDQFAGDRHGNKPYKMSPDYPPLQGTFDLMTPLVKAVQAMRKNAASEIAALSGGEYVQFGGQRDLEQELGDLANHLPNRYVLSFRPTSNAAGLHTLRLEVPGHPELQIAARTSYWVSEGTP